MTTIDDGETTATIVVEAEADLDVGVDEELVAGRVGGSRRRLWWRLTGLLVAGGTVVGVSTHLWLQTRRELQELEARLTEADARLPEVSAGLISDRSDLDVAQEALGEARETLARRTAERDRSRAELEATLLELDDRRQQLQGRQTELQERETSGLLLEACLLGASEALNSVAVGDLASFARTLEKIGDTCAEAGAEL